jgi:hypothetical protein
MNMTHLNVSRCHFNQLGIACEAKGNDSLMLSTEKDVLCSEESEIGDFVRIGVTSFESADPDPLFLPWTRSPKKQ